MLNCKIEIERKKEARLMGNDPDRDEKGRFVKGCSYVTNITPEERKKRQSIWLADIFTYSA